MGKITDAIKEIQQPLIDELHRYNEAQKNGQQYDDDYHYRTTECYSSDSCRHRKGRHKTTFAEFIMVAPIFAGMIAFLCLTLISNYEGLDTVSLAMIILFIGIMSLTLIKFIYDYLHQRRDDNNE